MVNKAKNSAFWRGYFRMTGGLEKAIEWISAIAFFGITFVTLLQVLFRFVLHSPLIWSEEMTRYLGIFVVMLATSNALKHNEHIGIDVLSSKLPPYMDRPVQVFYSLSVIGVMGFLSYNCLSLTISNFHIPTPAMRIPIGVPYIGMSIGCIASMLAGVFNLIETIFNVKPDEIGEDGV
jgi:TRAP-type C4-dicarboxylate transport system, small permease component